MMLRTLLVAVAMSSVVLAGCLDADSGDGPASTPAGTTSSYGDLQSNLGPGFVINAFDSQGLPIPGLYCHDEVEITGYAPDANGAQTWSNYQVNEGVAMCNFEMTPDDGREGNEVTIAVNPTNPQNIVGGAKDYYPADADQCVWNGVYVTHDGGRTPYEDRSFDGSPWRAIDGDLSDFEQNYASTFWCTTDPVAYFDVGGNLYYLLMAYQTDPITGGKTGEGVGQGALNDWAFNRATQIVAVSDDGGDTFHTFTPVLEGTFPVNFADKGWIAASFNGVIHVMWWSAFLPGNMYFRSTDGGQTFSDPEILSLTAGPGLGSVDVPDPLPSVGTGSAGQGSFVDVGTGGEVYALWASGGVQLRRSTDFGSSWDEQRTILDTNSRTMPTIDGRDRRGGHPQLATDRNAESPFADALYVAWQDACQADTWSDGCGGGNDGETLSGTGIWVAASFDKGTTWQAPVRVSDGPTGADQWKIFPTISVSPGGVVDVSWMDSRDTRWIDCPAAPVHGEARCADQYQALNQRHTYSLDGGQTWSDDFQVRDADDDGWDPSHCHHQNGDIFIGDYNDIDSSWQAAHPVWPDTRDGHCDVYTATITRPMFADGWDADRQLEWINFILEHPL